MSGPSALHRALIVSVCARGAHVLVSLLLLGIQLLSVVLRQAMIVAGDAVGHGDLVVAEAVAILRRHAPLLRNEGVGPLVQRRARCVEGQNLLRGVVEALGVLGVARR